jgi:hypothetical protein
LKDATVCTEIDPYWAKGWYRKGLAQVGLEKYRDAEDSYRRGVGECCLRPLSNQFIPDHIRL